MVKNGHYEDLYLLKTSLKTLLNMKFFDFDKHYSEKLGIDFYTADLDDNEDYF